MIACPNCKSSKSSVIDSRNFKLKDAIYRRRRCPNCEHCFNTQEILLEPKAQPIKTKKPKVKTGDYRITFFKGDDRNHYTPRYNGINSIHDD